MASANEDCEQQREMKTAHVTRDFAKAAFEHGRPSAFWGCWEPKKSKKTFSFSLIERVILSAGAMLIFSVSFQIDQMSRRTTKLLLDKYMKGNLGVGRSATQSVPKYWVVGDCWDCCLDDRRETRT